MAASRLPLKYFLRQLAHCQPRCVTPALLQKDAISCQLASCTLVQKPLTVRFISTSSSLHKEHKHKTKAKVNKADDKELGQFTDVAVLRTTLKTEVERLQQYYVQQLSTRSSLTLVETMKISFEGQNYELQDLAQIAKKGKNLLAINMAGFPQATVEVMKALRSSSLGLNPSQDGTLISVPVPRMTKEHREKISKEAKAAFVNCKKSMDHIVDKTYKQAKQTEGVSEDEERRILVLLRLVEAEYLKAAEAILKTKQEELKLEE